MKLQDFLEHSYRGKRCLLYGGAGMMGSYMAERLVALGAHVGVIDNRLTNKPPSEATTLCVDICRAPDLTRYWTKDFRPDYAFNLAAKVTGITYNERHHLDMATVNSQLAVVPLLACSDLAVVRYVFFSSACVYPADAPIPTPEDYGLSGEPELTNAGYGHAKRFGERLCCWAQREIGMKSLVLRPSNMYSPRENFGDPHCHVIPRLAYRILNGENPLQIRGTGNAQRTFLHARDAAEGALLCAATEFCGVLNLAAAPKTETTIRGLVSAICELCRRKPEIEWTSTADEGYPRRLSDCAALNQVLAESGVAWTPCTPLKVGLKEVVMACRNWLDAEERHRYSGGVRPATQSPKNPDSARV